MSDTGLVWIREDFRIENNAALSYATQNHQNVIAFLSIIITIMTTKERLKNGGYQNLLKILKKTY